MVTKTRRKPPQAPPPENFHDSYLAEGKLVAQAMADGYPESWDEGDLVQGQSTPFPEMIVRGYFYCLGRENIRIWTGRGWHPIRTTGAKLLQKRAFKPEPCPECGKPLEFPSGNWQHCSSCSNSLPVGQDRSPDPVETDPEAPQAAIDPIPGLIETAQKLWGEIDQALEIVQQAEYSALDSARLLGETLLNLKKQTPHGQWETVRGRILHPVTGKALPSSTATLYQRISQNWEALSQAGITSVRAANEHLRQLKSATVAEIEGETNADNPAGTGGSESDPGNPETVPQWSEVGASLPTLGQGQNQNPQPIDLSTVARPGETDIPARGATPIVVPETCKPAIAPSEFNQEMANTTTRFGGCHSCRNRRLTDSGDRYWCDLGVFDDTLPLSFNWQHREGCQQFGQTPVHAPSAPAHAPAPNMESPKVRIKVSGKGAIADRLAAHVEMVIVEIGGQQFIVQPQDLQLEKM